MRKEEIEAFIKQDPSREPKTFAPVKMRLVGGRTFTLRSREHFIIGRTSMVVWDRDRFILINLGLVSSITPGNGKGR